MFIVFRGIGAACDGRGDDQHLGLFSSLRYSETERVLLRGGIVRLISKVSVRGGWRSNQSSIFARLLAKGDGPFFRIPVHISSAEGGRPFQLEVPDESR